MAGRRSGYAQGALALGGVAVTMLFGLPFIYWALSNWSRLYGPQADPLEALLELWTHVRWALAGLGFFACGWLWALLTSRRILRDAQAESEQNVPPKLG